MVVAYQLHYNGNC